MKRLTSFFGNQSKSDSHLKSMINDNEIVRAGSFSDEVRDSVHQYLVSGQSHYSNVLMINWDHENMQSRVFADEPSRSSYETQLASLVNHIKSHGGHTVHSNLAFQFTTHKELMNCLLTMKRDFHWLGYSDHIEHFSKAPFAHLVCIMKMDGMKMEGHQHHYLEISCMNDIFYS